MVGINPKLLTGILVGAAVGSAAALLLAPAKGKQSREVVRTKTTKVAGAVKNRLKKPVSTGVEQEG